MAIWGKKVPLEEVKVAVKRPGTGWGNKKVDESMTEYYDRVDAWLNENKSHALQSFARIQPGTTYGPYYQLGMDTAGGQAFFQQIPALTGLPPMNQYAQVMRSDSSMDFDTAAKAANILASQDFSNWQGKTLQYAHSAFVQTAINAAKSGDIAGQDILTKTVEVINSELQEGQEPITEEQYLQHLQNLAAGDNPQAAQGAQSNLDLFENGVSADQQYQKAIEANEQEWATNATAGRKAHAEIRRATRTGHIMTFVTGVLFATGIGFAAAGMGALATAARAAAQVAATQASDPNMAKVIGLANIGMSVAEVLKPGQTLSDVSIKDLEKAGVDTGVAGKYMGDTTARNIAEEIEKGIRNIGETSIDPSKLIPKFGDGGGDEDGEGGGGGYGGFGSDLDISTDTDLGFTPLDEPNLAIDPNATGSGEDFINWTRIEEIMKSDPTNPLARELYDLMKDAGASAGAQFAFDFMERGEVEDRYEEEKEDIARQLGITREELDMRLRQTERAYSEESARAQEAAETGQTREEEDYARAMETMQMSQHMQNVHKREELAQRGITPQADSSIAKSEKERLAKTQETERSGREILRQRKLEDIGKNLETTEERMLRDIEAGRESTALGHRKASMWGEQQSEEARERYKAGLPSWRKILHDGLGASTLAGGIKAFLK